MSNELALSGRPGATHGVGARLQGRAVGGEVARCLSGVALGLTRRAGAAVSVRRLQQVVQATAGIALAVQQVDGEWGAAVRIYGCRIDEIREAAVRQLEARRPFTAVGPASPARMALDQLNHERSAMDEGAVADADAACSQYAAVGGKLPRVQLSGPTATTWSRPARPASGSLALKTQAEQLAAARDPKVIARRWRELSGHQRGRLIEQQPLLIGNLEGIPLRDRDRANRVRMREHRAELAQHLEMLQWLSRGEPGAGVGEREQKQLIAEIHGMNVILGEVVPSAETARNRRITLVAFDPVRDSIVTYHGALDPVSGDIASSVRRIGVVIPGTNATLGNYTNELRRVRDLAEGSSRGAAYFVWRGSPMPEFTSHGSLVEPASRGFAEVGSPRLATFVNALPLPPGAELTPIAHSYGAVVLGGAEQRGLRADRVVYVAPAGLGRGVRGLGDFPATGQRPHFVLQTRNDGIVGWNQGNPVAAGLGLGHGRLHPLRTAGITRLETGYLVDGDPSSGLLETQGPVAAHSNPFTAGSTAMRNLVAVVEGREVNRFEEVDPGWERAMDRAPGGQRWARVPVLSGELVSSRSGGVTP
ncbi:alpha/beta hydrolase [Leucobacter chromiireducens]|uniref:DUF1023 domain-containing protein n=2 Tax=Leucobacter TaxID=55968 RepID=A0ABS1SJR0_9MICO|nr:alpha/beta hydrolase [Leucobacter chromiireducens]MBL3688410.1 hypothetical protein [Leucobacter chromiireducens subsp. chromiireducens]